MALWTDEHVALLRQYWIDDGFTASECARRLGPEFSRNAVIGKVHRLKLPKRAVSTKPKSKGWSPAAREAARQKKAALERARRAKAALLKPMFVAGKAKPKVVGLPVRGVNDAALVAGWLAQNGGPRRFEQAATGDPGMVALWLRQHGYQTSYSQAGRGVKLTFPNGSKRKLTLQELVAFADELRIAEGLEPVLVRAA